MVTGNTEIEIRILLEEYRALYRLGELRMGSLERRAPIAAATLAAFLGSITVLALPLQIVALVGVPIVLLWYLRTTIIHANSFEDVLRRIEEIEKAVNKRAATRLLEFQSSHPSRGTGTGGRTGKGTVTAVFITCLLLLTGCLAIVREIVPPFQAFYAIYTLLAAITLGGQFIRFRKYRYTKSQ